MTLPGSSAADFAAMKAAEQKRRHRNIRNLAAVASGGIHTTPKPSAAKILIASPGDVIKTARALKMKEAAR